MVTVARKDLEHSLASLSQSIKRSTPDSLLGVLDTNILTLYQEGYLSVWDTVPVNRTESDSSYPGTSRLDAKGPNSFSVDGSAFYSVVSAMAAEDLDLSIGEKSLKVKSGRSSVEIPYQDTFIESLADFPKFDVVVELPSEFMTALGKARRFVAKTEDKPSLSCISIRISNGVVDLFATDTFHLFTTKFEVDIDDSVALEILLPDRCIDSMLKSFTGQSVRIGVTERQHIVMATCPTDGTGMFVLTPGFNDVYPSGAFKLMEDEGKFCFVADRDKFIEAVRLGNSFSPGDKVTLSEADGAIRLEFSASRMNSDLFLEGTDIVESFTKATFNPRFLLDCLQSLDKRLEVRQQWDGQGPLRMKADGNAITLIHKIQI